MNFATATNTALEVIRSIPETGLITEVAGWRQFED